MDFSSFYKEKQCNQKNTVQKSQKANKHYQKKKKKVAKNEQLGTGIFRNTQSTENAVLTSELSVQT